MVMGGINTIAGGEGFVPPMSDDESGFRPSDENDVKNNLLEASQQVIELTENPYEKKVARAIDQQIRQRLRYITTFLRDHTLIGEDRKSTVHSGEDFGASSLTKLYGELTQRPKELVRRGENDIVDGNPIDFHNKMLEDYFGNLALVLNAQDVAQMDEQEKGIHMYTGGGLGDYVLIVNGSTSEHNGMPSTSADIKIPASEVPALTQ